VNREPTDREIAHARDRARRLGFELVQTDDKRFAICSLSWRYPIAGGVTFDEILIVLRRRAREDW